jgi:hypothetical protein
MSDATHGSTNGSSCHETAYRIHPHSVLDKTAMKSTSQLHQSRPLKLFALSLADEVVALSE